MKLIECVPNFSEGRDLSVIEAIRARIAAVAGASVLHVTSDPWHNRSVITFVAPLEVMVDAAIAAIRAARDNIDLTRHVGVHPRIGAADVVPFIPLDGATMDDCIDVAREVGRRVGADLGIPVYLYERAATRDSRRNLAEVRRGGFETLRDVIGTDPDRVPDFGPLRVHPTAGAVAIGARPFLIAFNAYVGDATKLGVAKAIAKTIRESSGGLPAVKALGLEVDGQAQVSMNLVDIDRTSLAVAYSAVEREARARGADVTWSEIIGLVPERAAMDVASQVLKLRDDLAGHVLERTMLAARAEQSLTGYIESVANPDAVPGGGSVAAIAGALAAALAQMVAGLTIGRAKYASVEAEMTTIARRAGSLASSLAALAQQDAEAYARVVDAQKLPHETHEEETRRDAAMQESLLVAARVPLKICEVSEEVARIAESVARRGNSHAITDAGVAALLASASCTGAAYNVRINVIGMTDKTEGLTLAADANRLSQSARLTAERVSRLVEASL